MPKFGKFTSFSKFLDQFEAERQQQAQIADEGLTLEARRRRRRPQPEPGLNRRNVVEVSGKVKVREPDDVDGDRHIRLRVEVLTVQATDLDVDEDLQRCVSGREEVFVAIRIGDRMGILNPPTTGLAPEDTVHLRGEWIPREQARSHGGEPMSVLHFTHHPIGFLCVESPEVCFS